MLGEKKKKMLETVTFDLCLLSDIALSFLLWSFNFRLSHGCGLILAWLHVKALVFQLFICLFFMVYLTYITHSFKLMQDISCIFTFYSILFYECI
jgi:hypothetical protein